jgi:WD repeat-containing protein 35
MLIECYYALEDFVSLGELMKTLPDGSPLLIAIGDKFQSVGLCNEGVAAFLKVGRDVAPQLVLHVRFLYMYRMQFR